MKKRVLALLLCGVMVGMTACGGNTTTTPAATEDAEEETAEETEEAAGAETLTGEADGFGGKVRVTLTVEDGTITAASIDAPDESPNMAEGPEDWKEQLEAKIVEANGSEFDAVTGASVTSAAVQTAVQRAMGVTVDEADTTGAPAMADPKEVFDIDGAISIGQAICAPHGEQSFAQITAVVYDDVIVAAYIDEFQCGDVDAVKAVPNADDVENFGAGFIEGKTLFSKRENADYYSDLMTDHANATVRIDDNYDIIQDYVVGKKISDLSGVDAVSGATLVDTPNYIDGIVEAAKNAQGNATVDYTGSSADLTLNFKIGAAHGNKCFSTAAALTDGTNILLSWIDEYQFGATDAVTGVPNGDKTLGENFAEGQVLFSKRVNADYYSDLMKDHADATVRLDDNYDAVQAHVNGMSIADATTLSNDENAVDAVSGATLVDTANYIALIVEAAK